MNILTTFMAQAGQMKSYTLYPNSQLDDNIFVRSLIKITMTIVKNISLPLKLLTRKNFGDRYFGIFDYIFYLIFMTIGAVMTSLYIIILPVFLITDGFNANTSWFEYALQFPIIYPLFIIYMAIILWKRFKKESYKSINSIGIHSNYPGDIDLSFIIGNSSSNLSEDEQEYFRSTLEPIICITIGLLILPLDQLMGCYLLIMSMSLKIENWFIKNERRNDVLDIIDSILDAKWREYIYEMVKHCHELNLPLEQAYAQLLIKTNASSKKRFIEDQIDELNLKDLSRKPDMKLINKLLNRK